MHLLELFCGTKSVGKAFEAAGWSVTSVDIVLKFEPTILGSVLDVTPEMVEAHGGKPDMIWASPPCTHYSRARSFAKTPRDLEGSDALVRRALDLAKHWGIPFMMENPQGMLMHRDVVKGIPMAMVDYCMYSDHRFDRGYQKRTCIWSDTGFVPSRPLCRRNCEHCVDGRHRVNASMAPAGRKQRNFSTKELYQIPPLLCEDFVRHINAYFARAAERSDDGAGSREVESARPSEGADQEGDGGPP